MAYLASSEAAHFNKDGRSISGMVDDIEFRHLIAPIPSRLDIGNGSGSSSYQLSERTCELNGDELERFLVEIHKFNNKHLKARGHLNNSKCDTRLAHQLGIAVDHITFSKIEVQVKYGIAYSEDDGFGKDKGLLFIDFNTPIADIIKNIGGRRNLAPETYSMQYHRNGSWRRLLNGMDWRCCLRTHKKKKYIHVRCLIEPPGNQAALN